LNWLNNDAEESVSRFDVLSDDTGGIVEQQVACDELHCLAKVMLCKFWRETRHCVRCDRRLSQNIYHYHILFE